MSDPVRLTLRTRVDDFSYQVTAAEDDKFWFRLERLDGRDTITDFFVGACPEQNAGSLLADCYRVLGITPQSVIVFGNISPSSVSLNIDVKRARDFYTACGKALLASVGAGRIDERLEKERGKYNLVLEAIRDVPATAGGSG